MNEPINNIVCTSCFALLERSTNPIAEIFRPSGTTYLYLYRCPTGCPATQNIPLEVSY